ncbi:3'-5' exonuclease [Pseudomonas stutzeri]|uniref:3'-5' exonuclease n=1 Tax=Stutzerimonas stutzeri TaxID=316 RepID=UPI00190DE3EE|nr:3'-5' exonuclease [Stutzerimonas stutzeri]MBK3870430.1 3'-5' exonuclease [Stutzerimonas stutzeri]
MTATPEVFISVDVEASGPIPGEYSMLSIGACLVFDDTQTFSCYLKPTSDRYVPEALKVTGLSLERLRSDGLDPDEAMQRFKVWVEQVTPEGARAVFVGFNASFDWSFVNHYFHYFLGENPFGIAALDIKSMYFGAARCTWEQTRSSEIAQTVNPRKKGDHDALHDALYQAELFRLIKAQLMSD